MSTQSRMVFDRQRFEQVYMQYYAKFVIIARRYVRQTAAAEDLVTESFISLWENREKLSGPDANIPAYLAVTVKNKCLDYLYSLDLHSIKLKDIRSTQERMMSANILSLQSLDPQKLFAEEIKDILIREMRRMPEITREVFELSRIYSKRYSEIAGELGIPHRRVTAEMQRALSHLKVALKDYLPADAIIWIIGTNCLMN
ncbi:MAG: RNA polymerase sigma-70 factor [Candidatus Cryptobacteroides sp.]